MEELLRDQEILNTIASLSSEEFDALKSTLPYDERFALDLYLHNDVIEEEPLRRAIEDLCELISVLKNNNKSYILELTFKEFFKGKSHREKALAIKDIKSIISTLPLEDARLINLYLHFFKKEYYKIIFFRKVIVLSLFSKAYLDNVNTCDSRCVLCTQ